MTGTIYDNWFGQKIASDKIGSKKVCNSFGVK